MTIASALTALNTDIQDARTAITNKGGTVTSGGGSSQLATDIATIPSGITPSGTINITTNGTHDVTNYASASVNVVSTKYGATVDSFLGDVNANGVLQKPSTIISNIVFNGIQDVGANALRLKFELLTFSSSVKISFPDLLMVSGSYACCDICKYSNIATVEFPLLVTISGSNAFDNGFASSSVSSISFPKLTTISGGWACNCMFNYITRMTSASFPELTTVSGDYACRNMFDGCRLVIISFPKLTSITGNRAFQNMLYGNNTLTDIYFNALTTASFGNYTNQFENLVGGTGTNVTHTLHFPSNLQTTISGLTGYPLFGGTSGYVTLSFDLPATS